MNNLNENESTEQSERQLFSDDISEIVDTLSSLLAENRRVIAAIAGPPAAGKSTFAENMALQIDQRLGRRVAVVLPMDGFHLDNAILSGRGQLARKGAPFTFDADGLLSLMQRVLSSTGDIAVPVFDREQDLARAGGRLITSEHQLVLVEGNYLLLDEHPWSLLPSLADCRIFLDVSEAELKRRLVQRWLDHGLSQMDAENRAETNDLTNARLVNQLRLPADFVVSTPQLR